MLGRLNSYLRRIGLFCILAALIAGMAVGCDGVQYNLTISSTEGGEVIIPGEGTIAYDEGAIVDLVAEPDEGYRFVNWTGNVNTIDNVDNAITIITMHGNYAITANFRKLEIRTWYDLDAVRDNLEGNHTLMNDLNSTTAGYEELAGPAANGGNGWQPIGTQQQSFTGSFDGQEYEIRDLYINRPDEDNVGLFAVVDEGGHIENTRVLNTEVIGSMGVGSLVGANLGNVSDSYSTGNITGYAYVGGLMGANGGTVSDSYYIGNVTGYAFVGGLMGENYGTVSNSYFTGSAIGNGLVGGLVGDNYYGTVSNSYSTGDVIGVVIEEEPYSGIRVGGLVGLNDIGSSVSDSYSTGSVTGNSSVGGLVGQNKATVSNSYSTGSVTGNSSVGGLVGENTSTVSNSFWDTETSGQATSAGGVGKNTTEMQDIITFSDAGWNVTAVANSDTRNPAYIWNIVDDATYPFLSWQAI